MICMSVSCPSTHFVGSVNSDQQLMVEIEKAKLNTHLAAIAIVT